MREIITVKKIPGRLTVTEHNLAMTSQGRVNHDGQTTDKSTKDKATGSFFPNVVLTSNASTETRKHNTQKPNRQRNGQPYSE